MTTILVIDSSTKIDVGTYQHSYTNLGHEEQCLKVRRHDNHGTIHGSYSLIRINFPESYEPDKHNISQPINYMNGRRTFHGQTFDLFSLVYGICHPHSCSSYDMTNILNVYFNHEISFNIVNVNRSLKHGMNGIQMFYLSILMILSIFTISSTLKYNLNIKYMFGSEHFNVINNVKHVIERYKMSGNRASRIGNILCAYKTLYLYMAICGHNTLIIEHSTINLVISLIPYQSYFPDLVRVSEWNAVGGTLLNMIFTSMIGAMITIPVIERINNPLKLFFMIPISRFFRLFPIIFVTISIVTLFPLLNVTSSGTFHNLVSKSMSDRFIEYGMYDLMFVTDFVQAKNMCLMFNYFMSVDFQLSLLTLPLLIVLVNDLRKGLKFATIYIFMAIVIEYTIYRMFNPRIIVEVSNVLKDEYSYSTISWPTNYISAHVVGLIVGTIITKNVKFSFNFNFQFMKKYPKIKFYIDNYTLELLCGYFGTLGWMITLFIMNIDDWNMNMHMKHVIASFIRSVNSIGYGFCILLILQRESICIPKIFIPFVNFISTILLPCFASHWLIIIYMGTLGMSKFVDYTYLYFIAAPIVVFVLTIISGICLHILIELPFGLLMKKYFKLKR